MNAKIEALRRFEFHLRTLLANTPAEDAAMRDVLGYFLQDVLPDEVERAETEESLQLLHESFKEEK